jgi:hypothetical protein
MKNISTGTGIALLAGAIVAYPILDRVMPKADASTTHAAAVVAAATVQVEPTIVWYGVGNAHQNNGGGPVVIVRAWSNGRVEATAGNFNTVFGGGCIWNSTSCSGWVVISDPAQGYNYRSDINFDSKVDGADLGALLADWGDAPRQDIPPSDCPLNLINP